MASSALLAVAVVLAAIAGTARATCSSSSDYLAAINAVRANHQAPALVWSSALEDQAQALADTWAVDRDCLVNGGLFLPTNASEIQETRAISTGGPDEFDTEQDTCAPVIGQWYKTITDYSFTTTTPWQDNFVSISYNFQTGKSRGPVPNLAQLLWRPTKKVGCALAQGDTCWIVVCVFDRFFARDAIQSGNPERTILQNIWPPVVAPVFPPPPGPALPPPQPGPPTLKPPAPPPPACSDRSTACKLWSNSTLKGCTQSSPFGIFENKSVAFYWCRVSCKKCKVTAVPRSPPPSFPPPPSPTLKYDGGACKPTTQSKNCADLFGQGVSNKIDCDGDGILDLVCSPRNPYDYMIQQYLVYLSSANCTAATDFIGLYDVRASLLPNFLPGNDPLWLVCPGAKTNRRHRHRALSRKTYL